MKYKALLGNITENVQHCLKMQLIYLLPKYRAFNNVLRDYKYL
jgi:hypothetical protein